MPGKSFSACLLGLLLMLSSCYDEDNTYGSKLVDSAFRSINVDTCTVVITAVRMDSIETSATSTALIGQYTHDDWGKIRTWSYIAYNRASYSTDILDVVTLDSVELRLSFDGYSIGDTTKYQHFKVHRLTQKIELNDNSYLYNTSTVDYDPEVLGEFSFKPRPNHGELVQIRLNDEFGQDLLDRFHTQDDIVSSERFEDYFKGLVIIPDEQTSSSIQAFAVNDSFPSITVHYQVRHKGEHTFSFYPKTDTQFNHIDHYREGSLLENYTLKQNEIPSGELENKGLLFGGLGWYSRLEFPYLNNIMVQGEIVGIESAILKIYPENGSYSDFNVLPENIYLYIADENNVVVDAVKDYLGSEVQKGTLVRDHAYPENTYYYFDVSTFMQEELGTEGKNKHNLQLVFDSDDYIKTFRNLTYGDRNGKLPVTLQLTYKIYESY